MGSVRLPSDAKRRGQTHRFKNIDIQLTNNIMNRKVGIQIHSGGRSFFSQLKQRKDRLRVGNLVQY